MGLDSSVVCPSETYGLNCTGTCSPNCASNKIVEPSSCHHVSGVCVFGCRDGHSGAKCDSVICNQKGFYGQYCGQACSQFCKTDEQSPDPICHPVSGICLLGCQDGYDGPRCDVKLCTNDTYGDQCQYNCSSYCQRIPGHMSCDPETGVCLIGCQDGYFGFFCDTATGKSSHIL
ncbi:multiple epidermal growth factor-like domains protein 10 [Physella acuta]|uniref:multiple epidermal growth factor-like domains protein 10 n=1 Tax=Physella acuta TaxID=109671 RepID=UPI0027DE553B|nr:multiple epidermal growth factor-like domains protein 10 [Physella acuta]